MTGTEQRESYYSISCGASSGAATESAFFGQLWAHFQSRMVRNAEGHLLGYYRGDGRCGGAGFVTVAGDLIQSENGQCHAWAELLQRCAQIHGIGSAEVRRIRPKPVVVPDSCDGTQPKLLVKNYTLVDPTFVTGCAEYPYCFNSPCPGAGAPWPNEAVADAAGVQGQDEPDPMSYFDQHFIVKYGGQYYDPSYGASPFNSVADWENASIFGYATTVGQWDLRLGVRLDDPAIQETQDGP